MAEWSKKVTKEALREVASQVVWAYWPIWGAPLMGGLLAYISGYNVAEIFILALFAFAMIALALNNISQWMDARSPAGKVDFLAPAIGVKNDRSKDPAELVGLKLGALLRSTALFPIEVRIDDLETQIADRVPSEAFFVRSVITRDMGAQFRNGIINLADLERKNKLLYGHISARVSYGRPGRLKYTAAHQWYMAFKFDKDGNFEGAEPSTTAFARTED